MLPIFISKNGDPRAMYQMHDSGTAGDPNAKVVHHLHLEQIWSKCMVDFLVYPLLTTLNSPACNSKFTSEYFVSILDTEPYTNARYLTLTKRETDRQREIV